MSNRLIQQVEKAQGVCSEILKKIKTRVGYRGTKKAQNRQSVALERLKVGDL